MFLAYPVVLTSFLLFYWFYLDGKKISIKTSSAYFYVLFLTVVFTIPSSFYQSIYIFFWFALYCLGVLIFRNVKVSIVKNDTGIIILIVLCVIFLYIGTQRIIDLKGIDLNYIFNLHESRQDVQLSYFEYLFSRSLFVFPCVFLFYIQKSLLWRIFIVLIALAISISSLQKSPIVFTFFGLVLFKVLQTKNEISLKKVFAIIVFFVVLTVFTSLIMYQSKVEDTFDAVLNRIFFKPGKLAMYAMQMVDDQGKFYYGGASFASLYKQFDLDTIKLGVENYYYVYGYYAGTANTPCFTGAYADFGMVGSIYAFFIGGVLRIYDNTVLKGFKKNPSIFFIAAYTTSLVLSLKLNITVLGSSLMGEGLFSAMVITYLAVCTSKSKIRLDLLTKQSIKI